MTGPGAGAAAPLPDTELEPVKVRVEGTCPECGGSDLRRYPVLGAEGWFEVVKCQRCLASLSRERWHRLGWVRLAEDAL
jgi:NMD protein affecting ribosome stability and mRNA decay